MVNNKKPYGERPGPYETGMLFYGRQTAGTLLLPVVTDLLGPALKVFILNSQLNSYTIPQEALVVFGKTAW